MKRELNGSQRQIATVDNFIDTDWGMLYPSKESNVLNPPLAGDTELIHANRELNESLKRFYESTPMLWLFINRGKGSPNTGWFWYFTPERMREINLYVKAKERMKSLTSIGNQTQEYPMNWYKKPEGVSIDVSVLEKYGKFLVPELTPIELIEIFNFVRKNSTPLNSRCVDQLRIENERLTTEVKDYKEEVEAAKDCIQNLGSTIESLKKLLSY